MKKTVQFFALLILLISCDDGDIIVTAFEFDEADLQLCEGSLENEFVFFKINTEIQEAISYNFVLENFSDSTVTTEPIVIPLGDDNQLVYRQFDNAIDASYYCNIIPDGGITVTNESVSSMGTAQIEVFVVGRNDNDGVPTLDDDPTVETEDVDGDGNPDNDDTDGDMIPNFIDQDDDNDNILTIAELSNTDPDDDSFLNSDDDDIPDYRDPDDDNDGILTRHEDIDGNGNPRDDDTDGDGKPNYLDDDDDQDGTPTSMENADPNGDGIPADAMDSDNDNIPDYLDSDKETDEVPDSQEMPPLLRNTIETTFRNEVNIFDLKFDQNTDQFEQDFFSFGVRDVNYSKTTDPK